MNKTIIVGRLTATPEIRQTQSGVSCCRFTVAVNRKYKNEQTGEYDADFITCVAWRQTADFVGTYFDKGKMIALEGTLRNNNFQDKNYPDVTHYTLEVLVENVEFVGGKNEGGGSSTPVAAPQAQKPRQYKPKPKPAPAPEPAMDLSDFEEILSDGDVPF